ncbi:hypothetical protein ACFOWU_05165 [Epilithonimonas zeae]|uniref:Uncharacterized protein n=1 Tax=Epilithonimonas zeae TaxID=1416779 RepID=A0A1N6F6S6_9FLAO|nr:hypothetical protein [Epilithonimonas zeae]SIN90971.1 hypothetical protein SAMN05444409_1088 [Epilithonimonas zeae]
MKNNNLNLVERVKAPTPKWFKIVRAIGITLTAVGGAILTAPVAIPATIVTVAGYLVLGGTIATAVAQTAIQAEESNNTENKDETKNAEKP